MSEVATIATLPAKMLSMNSIDDTMLVQTNDNRRFCVGLSLGQQWMIHVYLSQKFAKMAAESNDAA